MMNRDHHTVLRALAPDHVEDLVYELALCGRREAAEEVAIQIGSQEVSETLEQFITDLTEFGKQELTVQMG